MWWRDLWHAYWLGRSEQRVEDLTLLVDCAPTERARRLATRLQEGAQRELDRGWS